MPSHVPPLRAVLIRPCTADAGCRRVSNSMSLSARSSTRGRNRELPGDDRAVRTGLRRDVCAAEYAELGEALRADERRRCAGLHVQRVIPAAAVVVESFDFAVRFGAGVEIHVTEPSCPC